MRFSLKRRSTLRLCGLALLGALPGFARAQSEGADPAVRQVRAFYDALLAVMKQADRLGISGRYEKLAPVIRVTFDLAAMTRIAVGHEWNSIASAQQSELIENFSRMTIATYANRFNGYSGERFEVESVSDARSTGRIVRTTLVQSKGEPVTLNYLMRGSGDAWKIVDIYLTGTISELATKRSEFAAVLKTSGPSGLIDTLRQQADRLMRPPGAKGDATR